MNVNTPGDADRLAARIDLQNRRVPRAIASRVVELADGGLDIFEIQSVTGLPLPLINLILRGATPGVTK